MTCVESFKASCKDAIDESDPEKIVIANKFITLAARISTRFPLLFLPKFLDEFMDGTFTKKLIKKYHIHSSNEYQMLVVDMLKMPVKRSRNPDKNNMRINMANKKLAAQYTVFSEAAKKFHPQLTEMHHCNILRTILVHAILERDLITSDEIEEVVRSTYSSMSGQINVLASAGPLERFEAYIGEGLSEKIYRVAGQLAKDSYITRLDGDVSSPRKYTEIKAKVYDKIRNSKEGISYSSLKTFVTNNFPLIRFCLDTGLLDRALASLDEDGKTVRKRAFWMHAPYSDQFFSKENYEAIMNLMKEEMLKAGRTKFFGRRMTPDMFVSELKSLDPGDIDDQDDQVTRIAGLVLSNSALLQSPRETSPQFDFVVDLSSYEFRPEQERLMNDIEFKITSKILHCKVMIDRRVTPKTIDQLHDSVPSGEQAVVFTCRPVSPAVAKMTREDPVVQVVDEDAIRKWSGITPVIPCRRGSAARVKYGDDAGRIVLIKALNYESGRATVDILPDHKESTLPIGSLEEIDLHASSPDELELVTDEYIKFLHMLESFSPTTFTEGLEMDVVAVHASRADLLKSTNPELFGGAHPPLKMDYNMYKSTIVQLENANVRITNLECDCNYKLNDIYYRTLCRHEVAALNHMCTMNSPDVKTCISRMHKFTLDMDDIRNSNLKRMADVIYDALESKTDLQSDPAGSLVEYIIRHAKTEP